MSDNPNNTYGSIQNMMGGSIGYTKFRPAPGDEIQIGGVLNIVTDQGVTADLQLNGVTVAATAGVPGGVTNNVQYKDGANFEGIAGMNFVTKDEVRLGDLAGGIPMTLSMEANPAASVAGRGTELNILGGASTQYVGGAVNIASGTGALFSGQLTLTSGDMVLETVAGENRSITINPDGLFEVAADNILETSLFGFDLVAGGALGMQSSSAINMHLTGGAQLEIYVDDEITADIDIHTGEITGGQSGDINIFNGADTLGGTVGDTNITAGNLNVSTTTDVSLTTGNNIVNTLGTTGTNSQTVGALIVKDSVSTSVANITDTGVLNCTSVAAGTAVITANAQVNTLTADGNITQGSSEDIVLLQALNLTANNGRKCMAVKYGYAYVVGTTNTMLEILNVNDPTAMTSVSTLVDSNFAHDNQQYAYVKGDILYNVNNTGVVAVDVHDKANPVILSKLTTTLTGFRCNTVSGNFLYTFQNGSLVCVNVSDPNNMFEVSTLTDALFADITAVTVSGNYLYGNSFGNARLVVVDITDPTAMVIAGSVTDLTNLNGALDIRVKNGVAYMVGTNKVVSFDISDPTAMVFISTISLGGTTNLEISGNLMYCPSNTGFLRTVDISDPTVMVLKNTYSTTVAQGTAINIKIVGNIAYLSSLGVEFSSMQLTGLEVQAISCGSITTSNVNAQNVSIQGDLDVSTGLTVSGTIKNTGDLATRSLCLNQKLTQTNTTDLNILQQLTMGGVGANRSLVIQGNYAYVVTSTNLTLNIIDITNPNALTVVGTLFDADFSTISGSSIFIIGDVLYIPSNSVLSTVNVKDRTNPVIISTLSDATYNGALTAYISGKYYYTCTSFNNFVVYDISDAENITLVSSIADGSNRLDDMRRIEVRGSYAYCVATLADKLTIVDISDPYLPVVVSSIIDIVNFDNALGIVVTDNYLYAALAGTNGLGIVNIQDPTTPVINTAVLAGNPSNLAISGDYIYLVGTDQIDVINIEDPTNPVLINTTTPLLGVARQLVISGNVGYTIGLNAEFTSVDMNGTKLSTLKSGNIKTDSIQVTQNLNVEGLTTLDTLSMGGSALLGETGVTSLSARSNITQTNTTEVSPIQILTSAASGIFRAMTVQDNFGYVVGKTNTTLEIFDVTDPSNIISLSTLVDATAFAGSKLRIQGSVLYVLGGGRVASVDVSDPSNPVVLQTLIDGSIMPTSRDIDISGMYLYVACNQRVTVLNIADPGNMFIAASLFDAVDLVGSHGIKVVGSYVYVMSYGGAKLTILDISDPLLPVVVGTLADATNFTGALDIQVRGNYAYITGTLSGGHYSAVDVSDKTAPVLASALVLNAKSSYISGNYAYVAAATFISVVDISDPTAMTIVSNYFTVGMGNVNGIYLSGSTGYTSSDTTHFATIDINGTSLSSLTVGTLKTASTSVGGGLAVQDDITTKSGMTVGQNMCVGNEFSVRSKITQTNTTDLNILQQLTLASTGANRSLVVQGNYAYVVTSFNTTLNILDITNPEDMTVVGTLLDVNFDMNTSSGMYIIGDVLYIPSITNDLSAVNVSDKTTPVTISLLVTGVGAISSIYVSGKYCYVVGSNRFTVVDISDPEDMIEVSTITDGSNRLDSMRKIEVRGSYAYCVANVDDKLTIVDISDPYLPVVVSSIIDASDFDNALGIVVTDNYLYAALAGTNGLGIVNIQDPTTPVINTAVLAGNPSNLAISGDYIYLVSTDQIDVINIEDPTNPILVNTTTPLLGIARQLVISGNVGYAVGLNDEFSSIDMNGTKLSTLQSGNIKTDSVQITQNLNVEGLTTLGTLSTGGSAQLGETSVTSLKTSGKNSVAQITTKFTSVSIDARSGTIDTIILTQVAGSVFDFTVNNDQVFASDLIFLTAQKFTGATAAPLLNVNNVVDGSFDIQVDNVGAGTLSGVLEIAFLIV